MVIFRSEAEPAAAGGWRPVNLLSELRKRWIARALRAVSPVTWRSGRAGSATLMSTELAPPCSTDDNFGRDDSAVPAS